MTRTHGKKVATATGRVRIENAVQLEIIKISRRFGRKSILLKCFLPGEEPTSEWYRIGDTVNISLNVDLVRADDD